MAQAKKGISQDQVQRAAQILRREAGLSSSARVDLGLVLGSGLGGIAASVKSGCRIPFDAIPQFPGASVAGHSGVVTLGIVERFAACKGDYEGHSLETVTFPIRVMGALGARVLILTNAAGGLGRQFRRRSHDHRGSHRSLSAQSTQAPTRRAPEPVSRTCPRPGRNAFGVGGQACAGDLGLRIEEGVYVAVPGPSYETPAEVEMLRRMGGDAVGMSTVPEVIVARHLGMECLGISVITNLATGLAESPVTHEDVLQVASGARERLRRLITSSAAGWRACIHEGSPPSAVWPSPLNGANRQSRG